MVPLLFGATTPGKSAKIAFRHGSYGSSGVFDIPAMVVTSMVRQTSCDERLATTPPNRQRQTPRGEDLAKGPCKIKLRIDRDARLQHVCPRPGEPTCREQHRRGRALRCGSTRPQTHGKSGRTGRAMDTRCIARQCAKPRVRTMCSNGHNDKARRCARSAQESCSTCTGRPP